MNRKSWQRHDGIGDREGHDQECGDRAAGHEGPDASVRGRRAAISHSGDSLPTGRRALDLTETVLSLGYGKGHHTR
jgi:hypothetical protein